MVSILPIILSEHKQGNPFIIRHQSEKIYFYMHTYNYTHTHTHTPLTHKLIHSYAKMPTKNDFAWYIKNAHTEVHTHTHKPAAVGNQKSKGGEWGWKEEK